MNNNLSEESVKLEQFVKESLYYCYSPKQKAWLKSVGFNFLHQGIHKSGKNFWVFVRTEELHSRLDEWSTSANRH
ncbi:hypothetical protein LC76P1_00170 [Lysinibacillus phage LC76P1]|nr:hypothetical protein LC76P1_00170 [Lysinibacillus phage LC76P1]